MILEHSFMSVHTYVTHYSRKLYKILDEYMHESVKDETR